jgi:hypothetical protein
MRNLLFVVTLLAAPTVIAAEKPDHFDIFNASEYPITSIGVAKAGGGVFRTAIDEHNRPKLLASGETLAIALHSGQGGCLRDLRITFGNGKVLVQEMFDACKNVPFRAAPPA